MKKPRVITVASRKGGTGKSTVSSHLCVCAGNAVLIDTDQQDTEGSSATWIKARREAGLTDAPRFYSYGEYADEGIDRLIERATSDGASHVIIDTAPAADAAITRILQIADVVVIVTEASFLPLHALPRSLEMAHAAGKPALVVVNKVKPNRRETNEVREQLKEAAIQFCELGDLTDYGRALAEGKAVHEFAPKSKSAQQIAALWQSIEGM